MHTSDYHNNDTWSACNPSQIDYAMMRVMFILPEMLDMQNQIANSGNPLLDTESLATDRYFSFLLVLDSLKG